MVNAPYGMLSRNLTANLWYKDNLLSLLYILDYPSFSSYHLELWLLHFRIRITKHVTFGFWKNITKSSQNLPYFDQSVAYVDTWTQHWWSTPPRTGISRYFTNAFSRELAFAQGSLGGKSNCNMTCFLTRYLYNPIWTIYVVIYSSRQNCNRMDA